jgi:xanthine dehydrogenase YagS FAD-binding subunit
MNSFTLTQAAAVDEAVSDFASHDGAAYLGGGTNLIDLMKENVSRPSHLTEPARWRPAPGGPSH